MEKPNWEKFDECIWHLEHSVYMQHEDYEMQRLIADALFELLKIPQWKLWIWLPKMLKVRKANNLHINCCDLESM